jgi:hypothetical protein
MYNTTTMTAINDGEVRTVSKSMYYKVTIPPGFVAANRNMLPQLEDGWVIGDRYVATANFELDELPDVFKQQLGLMHPAAAADGPGQRRGNNDDDNGVPDARRQRRFENEIDDDDNMGVDGMDGGKSNKRSIRRRRRSSSRKSRKSSRKSRNARRK